MRIEIADEIGRVNMTKRSRQRDQFDPQCAEGSRSGEREMINYSDA